MLPAKFRVLVVKRHLGPSGGYYSRDSFKGNVAELTGCSVKRAEIVDGKVKLTLDRNGVEHVHVTSHVICATGYRVNLDRLAFLPESIKSQIKTLAGAPVLDRKLSVHGARALLRRPAGGEFIWAADALCLRCTVYVDVAGKVSAAADEAAQRCFR